MPRRFVLWAHPERTSFTAQWAAASCAAAGEDVLVSDLYGMGFDPAERGVAAPLAALAEAMRANAEALRRIDASQRRMAESVADGQL